MQEYQVGELYREGHTTWPESTEFTIHRGQPEVRLFFNDVKQWDIDNIETGRMEFALFLEGPVIFFVYNFGSIGWSDAPFSFHRARAALPDDAPLTLPRMSVRSRLDMKVLLIEANTGILKVIRVTSFSPKFSAKLIEILDAQSVAPWPGDTVYETTIGRVYRRNPNPRTMFMNAIVTCRGEKQKEVSQNGFLTVGGTADGRRRGR